MSHLESSSTKEDIMLLFKAIYFEHLCVNPKGRSVGILQSSETSTHLQNIIATVLFEIFEVPSISFIDGTVSALSITGYMTGITIDIGEYESRIVPIFKGVRISNAVQGMLTIY